MAWFEYNQNNSGGSLDFDKKRGITHYVIIEARDADDADRRAEEIGMYWDGCNDGRDCSCCGDRWYPTHDKGNPIPTIRGQPAEQYSDWHGWMEKGHEIAIHPEAGDIRWHGVAKRPTE